MHLQAIGTDCVAKIGLLQTLQWHFR